MICNLPVRKGIVFAGCSFTWGQGLYYYSNLPSLEGKEPPEDCWFSNLVTHSHLRYMESVRYPRIVANHFKTWELVIPGNGGSNQSAINYWNGKLTDSEPNSIERSENYNYNDISHIVFQLTQNTRNNFVFEYNGERYDKPMHELEREPLTTIFLNWLESIGKTWEQWEEEYILNNIINVEAFLRNLESKGIKVIVTAWEDYYIAQVKANTYLNSKLIKFNYNGNEYETIRQLMTHNRELEIKHDVANFVQTPRDHHPSLKCHQVMAENIIKAIENGNLGI